MPVAHSLGVCILGLLAYDATTYSDRHIGQIPVNPIALSPQLGGEKNLPVSSSSALQVIRARAHFAA